VLEANTFRFVAETGSSAQLRVRASSRQRAFRIPNRPSPRGRRYLTIGAGGAFETTFARSVETAERKSPRRPGPAGPTPEQADSTRAGMPSAMD
jgi:hypothetical protein